ncbi:Alpha/Beta hydrolase protein [Pseudomassariella vexata]|uniref:Alpha/Beta hydrolase protein n=1 Tax=Pseudomassariella vexata TaxID=1141098 RepID=A0A1Y2E9I9_9PEZI|nr:Alpha/Beta hydrolase protein [Pseudomassariella vexata]ORY67525.1 Alpha/Beta hydrolase protein [Pseudomassariella vexata]
MYKFNPIITAACLAGLVAAATPVWETLPATPTLPGNPAGSKTEINGVQIWHAEFGTASADTVPVLFLHGGFGNADYWGDVIATISKTRQVIAMDNRGHGRSTMDSTPFTYELYASDAAGLLESLGIAKAAWVGWSDMGAGTLAALMSSDNSTLIDRAFVYGGFHSFSSTNSSFESTAIYTEFTTRAIAEYQTLQPDGDLTAFATAVSTLEATLPIWEEADFKKVTLGSKVTICGGQYEEAVVLYEPTLLNGWIAGSQLVMMTNVSHFAPVQDPVQFAEKVEAFLKA